MKVSVSTLKKMIREAVEECYGRGMDEDLVPARAPGDTSPDTSTDEELRQNVSAGGSAPPERASRLYREASVRKLVSKLVREAVESMKEDMEPAPAPGTNPRDTTSDEYLRTDRSAQGEHNAATRASGLYREAAVRKLVSKLVREALEEGGLAGLPSAEEEKSNDPIAGLGGSGVAMESFIRKTVRESLRGRNRSSRRR